jgi:tRNA A37 threonylcarbamoyladenosine dehydratase
MDKRDKYYYGFLKRSVPILTEDGIRKLRSSTIAIAGLGGVGGAAVITLARLGVGGFKLADPGKFDLPDINRQWAAFKSTLGESKVEAYEKVLRDINLGIKIEKINEGVTEDNLDTFLKESNIVVECLDYVLPNRGLREKVYHEAKERGIPVISSGICGFGALMVVYLPNGMSATEFYRILQERVKKRCSISKNVSALYILLNLLDENFDSSTLNIVGEQFAKHQLIPSLSLAPALSASLVATECVVILLQNILSNVRKPICAPRFLTVDLLRNSYNTIDATKI